LRFKIDWASLIIRSKFTLYLRAIFQVQPPGGLYLEWLFNGGFFFFLVWRAYIWRGLFSEFYGVRKRRACQIGPAYDLLFIILSKRCELRARLLF